jgi:hypothetical protein
VLPMFPDPSSPRATAISNPPSEMQRRTAQLNREAHRKQRCKPKTVFAEPSSPAQSVDERTPAPIAGLLKMRPHGGV